MDYYLLTELRSVRLLLLNWNQEDKGLNTMLVSEGRKEENKLSNEIQFVL